MLADLLSDFRASRPIAGDDVDRATCWPSSSPGRPCSALHLTSASQTHIYARIRKCLCSHTQMRLFWRVCVRACVSVLQPNKAGCLLLAGFGGRFASMPSLSPEGGRDGGMRGGGLPWRTGRGTDVVAGAGPSILGGVAVGSNGRRTPLLLLVHSRDCQGR